MNKINIAAITVTYHPDIALLSQQLNSLSECLWVIVDNGSAVEKVREIEFLIQYKDNCILIQNNVNQGLAKAINTGAYYITKNFKHIEFLFLLDQDSTFIKGTTAILHNAFINLESKNKNIGCVGPKLVDFKTQQQHGFHHMQCGLWRRIYPSEQDIEPIKCTNINGSGTFMRLEVFLKLNGLMEELFIDHIDTEWSFRLLSFNYQLYGIPEAIFDHRMGEDSFKFWLLGWRVWPLRTPLRQYFLLRNTLKLIKLGYVPLVWKFWAIIKIFISVAIYTIFFKNRIIYLKSFYRGIVEGLRFKD